MATDPRDERKDYGDDYHSFDDDGITRPVRRPVDHTTVVSSTHTDHADRGTGIGLIVAVLLVIALAVGAFFAFSNGDVDRGSSSSAVSEAARSVGQAAKDAGEAAKSAAENAGSATKDAVTPDGSGK